ncbi:hypothetical protein SAMN04487969_11998 [Paenibacillus algorifonticola]|uniref:Uncharacterized protein n=1 Tax=Paenibacillus algorifonticola TaxID=684063 RepID=A0A1I2H239_9BACL|nr:hypothetical protein [Paenibacillus algorifonticola]SFF23453.1 hypothetical protein SAMN04487969_11998 [Paenibacillus algorifonticola]
MKQKLARKLSKVLEKEAIKSAESDKEANFKIFIGTQPVPKELRK